MTIGLKDLNKNKAQNKTAKLNTGDSLLDLILFKHEEKYLEKNQKRTLRPWESFDESSDDLSSDEVIKRREEAIIEMSKKIKKRAIQLFGK